MGTFKVDLHEGIRAQGANDDIVALFGGLKILGPDSLPAGHFPDPAMIEAELLDLAAPDAIDPAVSHVANPGSLWPQQQGGAGGAHAGKLLVLLAAGVNANVGLLDRLMQGWSGALLGVFLISMGNDAGSDLAGQLAHRMAPHAVGHHENVSELPPLRFVTGRQDREGVLVMTTANPDVCQAGMLNLLVANHGESPLF